jgi:hypothetical protein
MPEITQYDHDFATVLRLDISDLPEAFDALGVSQRHALNLAEADRDLARHDARRWRQIATMNARRLGHWKAWALTFSLVAACAIIFTLGLIGAILSR